MKEQRLICIARGCRHRQHWIGQSGPFPPKIRSSIIGNNKAFLDLLTANAIHGGFCEEFGQATTSLSNVPTRFPWCSCSPPTLRAMETSLGDQSMQFSSGVSARDFFDPYGNICTRLVAPAGLLEVRSEFIVEDSGLPDETHLAAKQCDINTLPGEVLPFLLASRYCDTEKLSNLAWFAFRWHPGRLAACTGDLRLRS